MHVQELASLHANVGGIFCSRLHRAVHDGVLCLFDQCLLRMCRSVPLHSAIWFLRLKKTWAGMNDMLFL